MENLDLLDSTPLPTSSRSYALGSRSSLEGLTGNMTISPNSAISAFTSPINFVRAIASELNGFSGRAGVPSMNFIVTRCFGKSGRIIWRYLTSASTPLYCTFIAGQPICLWRLTRMQPSQNQGNRLTDPSSLFYLPSKRCPRKSIPLLPPFSHLPLLTEYHNQFH